jgi:hypothetical protein
MLSYFTHLPFYLVLMLVLGSYANTLWMRWKASARGMCDKLVILGVTGLSLAVAGQFLLNRYFSQLLLVVEAIVSHGRYAMGYVAGSNLEEIFNYSISCKTFFSVVAIVLVLRNVTSLLGPMDPITLFG